MNFSFVNDRLALGEHITTKERLNVLLEIGISHIVNLQIEADDRPLLNQYAPHIQYLHLGVYDDHENKENEWYRKIINFTLKALAAPKNKVYIHCAAGRSRSGTAVYAALRSLGFSDSDSTALIMRARPSVTLDYYRECANRAVRELGY